MEGKRHDEEGEKERNVWESESESSENGNGRKRKGKSCKGTLFYSSNLKSNGRNPRCVGFSRSLQQVPRYIVSESEVEASKEGRSLSEFKYACVGYSIYLDNNNNNNNNKDAPPPPPPPPLPPSAHPKPRPELPVCVGIELLVDKRPADHQTPAHAHTNTNTKQDDRGLPQHRPPKTPHPMGEEFFTRFSRNAGLVASGVARNMRKVGNYVKESIDDILYRRPK